MGQFSEIEIYTSFESWINKLSIDLWFARIGQYFGRDATIWKLWEKKCEKITFKVVHLCPLTKKNVV